MPCTRKPGSILRNALLAVAVGTALIQPVTVDARVLSGSVTERKQNRKIENMLKSARKNYDSGKVQPSIDAYWKILELDPLETFAYLELGEIYVELRIYDRAVELLEPGLNMAEREMDKDTLCYYYCILTSAHLALNQTGQANKTLIRAAEASPQNPMPRKILGDIYLANNRIADALKAYRKAVDLDPDYQPAKEKLGELTARYGDQLPSKTRDKKVIREKAEKLPPAETRPVIAARPVTSAPPPKPLQKQPDNVPVPKPVPVKSSEPSNEETPIPIPTPMPKPSAVSTPPVPIESVAVDAPPEPVTEDIATESPVPQPPKAIATADVPVPETEAEPSPPRPVPIATETDVKAQPAQTVASVASAAAATTASTAPSASDKDIEAQLDKFLAGTPEEKKMATSFFVKLEDKGLTEMEELLYDPDPEVRILAIRALPEFKAFAQRVKTMLEDAVDDPDPMVVEEINKALQNL